MPNTKTVTIPSGMQNQSLKKADSLQIKVEANCTWCYSDPDGVFPAFLAAGTYMVTNPNTVYGPYVAANAGTVSFNSVTSGDCNPTGITDAGHTIIVTS